MSLSDVADLSMSLYPSTVTLNTGDTTAPCGTPLPVSVQSVPSMTPAFNHLNMRRITRLSPIRCSRNRTSQSRFTVSKNARTSVSNVNQHSTVTHFPSPTGTHLQEGGTGGEAPPPGQALLGTWVNLNHIRQRHQRYHQVKSGSSFPQVMPPVSAGGSSLHIPLTMTPGFQAGKGVTR